NLITTLGRLGEYEVLFSENAFIYLGRDENDDEQLEVDTILEPTYVAVCISDDGTITSLGILSRRGFELNIYDLVSTYNMPDAVTWVARPLSRIVFWFDKGVAAAVEVIEETQIPHRITDLYYFPFVDVQSFEDEYP